MTALLHLPRLSRSRSLEGWHTGSGTVPKFPVDSIKKRVGQLLDSPKYFPLPVVLKLVTLLSAHAWPDLANTNRLPKFVKLLALGGPTQRRVSAVPPWLGWLFTVPF